MFQRRIPEHLRHAPTRGVRGFAVLASMEAAARGILTSVFPIAMYRSLGDAQTVSEVYFAIGLLSMVAALFTPWLTRFVPRRILYTAACLTMIAGNLCAAAGSATETAWLIPAGLTFTTLSVVVITVCFNAYVMDYVARSSLGQCETLRLFYSGAAWSIGPFLGVWLMDVWAPAPFCISIAACLTLLATFWVLRLGNGKIITKARGPAANPLGYLPRFLAQPRLIVGWTFAVIRSSGWWIYVVYLPIYAVEQGFSDRLGGLALSASNSLLFATPLILRWMQAHTVRQTILIGFFGSAAAFTAAALASDLPVAVIALLMVGAAFLVLLDVSAGLPFLMAVRPSERTEMSAVYSTFRDVSGVLSPAAARVVLSVAPLVMVFAVGGLGLAACGWLALKLHPRLGRQRVVAQV